MANVATLTAKMVMDVSGFSAGAAKVTSTLNSMKGIAGSASGSIGSLATSMLAGAAGGAALGAAMTVLNTGMSAVKATATGLKDGLMWGAELAADQEQAQVAFETMLHSGEAATAMLKNLEGLATRTPFDFPEVRDSAKSLMAMGIASRDVQRTLVTLGEIASGVGVPLQQLSMVFGQVKASGRLMTQDMNQFTNAGVALPRALAKELGIAETSVRKFVETGGVSFKKFQNAIIRLAETDFAGGMVKQSQTALGALSTLKDQTGGLFKDIASSLTVKLDTTAWINDLAGFVGFVRNNFADDLAAGFSYAIDLAIDAIDPLRGVLALVMKDMAALTRFGGNVTKSVTDAFSDQQTLPWLVDLRNRGNATALGANLIASDMEKSARKLEDTPLRDQVKGMRAMIKYAGGLGAGGEDKGLQASRFTDLGKGIGEGVANGFSGALSNIGSVLGSVGTAGGRDLAAKFLTPDVKPEQKPTAALVAGSSEAFSAIIRSMTGRDAASDAKRTAKATEETVKKLETMTKEVVSAIKGQITGVLGALSG